ncbi:3-phosphoserine/phosphohydroxythreonine transaminase [Brachymonas denitrificans]|uniref:Phosphoserine aminotransferase n=1 Tax=Brachymonas denitrificans DSM 15123 TaxID=1121117 RepID=A0A1H8HEK9_9BURK|nr:3-phosphoserine/phosphohydroxythreonine transaminase [Brachymonas denitrificans]SEN54701.1 phosphoserine aminotransferase apoenzyme [Brachymonas denitrificans DSM 15123]
MTDSALRPYNFSAGPAAIPEPVLRRAAAEMLDWPFPDGRRSGMGVMEMSHRGEAFGIILQQALDDLRELLAIPDNFRILFMQGGGLAENAIVPLNLSHGEAASFVVTGGWSQKSHAEAGKFCQARLAANAAVQDASGATSYTHIPAPESWQLDAGSRYVHICSNETIHGVEFHQLPDLAALDCNAPLVVDFSSNVASRPMDWSKVGLAFGGAQKNLGPAGLTLVVVREDLLGQAMQHCPSAFDYTLVAKNNSMYNTPPTYGIYMAGLTFQWIKAQGGVAALEAQNIAKAQLLYDFLDSSSFFSNRVDKACRSRMNVPFFLADESRNADFLAGAQQRGLLQLKGHKSVGGMRASIYNAMPMAGVQALVDYLREFEAKHA